MDWALFWSMFLTNKEVFYEFIFSLDEDVFKNAVMANVMILTRKFVDKYKRPPDFDTLLLLLERLPESEKENRAEYESFINLIKNQKLTIDVDVFKEETYRALKDYEMEKFILSTANKVGRGVTFEDVLDNVKKIMTKFQTNNLGVEVKDVKRMLNFIRHQHEDRICTGLPSLNRVLGGGWGTNELAIIMAPPNRGKSAFLLNVAYNTMLVGKNVLYITLEMSEKAVIRRLYSRIGYMNRKEMFDEEVVEKHANKFFNLCGSRGRVIYFPSKSVSVSKVEALLEQMQLYNDFRPDVLIVDYLDLLAPSSSDMRLEPRHRLRGITEDLRSIALRRGIACVTATQTSRSALAKNTFTEAQVSESFGKIEVSDVVIALCQTDEEFDANRARLYMAKVRDNKRGGSLEMFVDFDRMVIMDVDLAVNMKLLASPQNPVSLDQFTQTVDN